jgi:hypothetical protein
MSSNEIAVSARYLRGEICALTEVRGVSVLETKKGADVVKIVEGFADSTAKMNKLITDLADRVAYLEKKLEGSSGPLKASAADKHAVTKLKDLKDVKFDAVEEGSLIVYRKGFWVSELPADE